MGNFEEIYKTNMATYFSSGGPKVGIFWLTPDGDRILWHSESLVRDGLSVGNEYVCSSDNHKEEWNKIKVLLNPKYTGDYTSLPRGRVVYDHVKDKYIVLGGRACQVSYIKDMIISWYDLAKEKVIFELDENQYKI